MKAFRKIVRPGTVVTQDDKYVSVFVKIRWDGTALSLSGVVGPTSTGDAMGSSGQIKMPHIKNFAPGWDTQKVETLWEIWNAFHLNDLTAGCEHQRALGWGKRRLDDSKETGWHVGPHANLASWAQPSENPRGVLMKPCPICGYKYGSRWLTREVPGWALSCLLTSFF